MYLGGGQVRRIISLIWSLAHSPVCLPSYALLVVQFPSYVSPTQKTVVFLLFNEKLKLAYILRKTFLTLLIKMMTFTLWLSFSFSFHFRLLFSIHSLPSPNSFSFILVSLSKFHLFSYLRRASASYLL